MDDFDVHFYNPELAVANFIGEFQSKDGVTLRRFRIMDIYAKRKGNWIQVASHTVVDPELARGTDVTATGPSRRRFANGYWRSEKQCGKHGSQTIARNWRS